MIHGNKAKGYNPFEFKNCISKNEQSALFIRDLIVFVVYGY